MPMVSIDPNGISDRENYKLLIGSVIPRPIAFVTTLSESGVWNAAPFSYFSIVSSSPPMLSVSIQRKAGVMKDTARNAIATGSLVIHIVDESIVGGVNETAVNLPPDASEVDLTDFTAAASEVVPVPGIAEANIRMECVLEQAIPLGGTGGVPACDLLICRVVRFHLASDVYDGSHIQAEALRPVSRLAGNDYAALGRVFTIGRPQ